MHSGISILMMPQGRFAGTARPPLTDGGSESGAALDVVAAGGGQAFGDDGLGDMEQGLEVAFNAHITGLPDLPQAEGEGGDVRHCRAGSNLVSGSGDKCAACAGPGQADGRVI